MSGRIYWRYRRDGRYCYHYGPKPPPASELRGATPRAWADFRNLGAEREPLVARGDRFATSDPELAEAICAERVRELKRRKLLGEVADVRDPQTLGEFAPFYLEQKAAEDITTQWVRAIQMHMDAALEFFGKRTGLTQIKPSDVRAWIKALKQRSEDEGGPLSPGSCRKYINSLSGLYSEAQNEEVVPPGFNPVAALKNKPRATQKEPKWLEHHTAAALLEAARTSEPKVDRNAIPFGYEIVGTALLTGLRKSELLGLEVRDLDLDRRTIRVRPNQWRRLKSKNAHRTVPIPTQLVEILEPHVSGRIGLAFPSPVTGRRIKDVRKLLDRYAARIGLPEGRVRLHGLRHTFASSAIQLLDNGEPISMFTVSRWLGHGGESLTRRIYTHLGEIRHRSEELEYRIENHEEEIDPDVLEKLRRAS